jgi:hypothetical protein
MIIKNNPEIDIYEEFNKIYDKQAKEIFDLEKSEEEFANHKKNYDKYFQQCLTKMSEIDMQKVVEESLSIENEIKLKVSEIELIEQNFKKFIMRETTQEASDRLSEDKIEDINFIKEYEIISKENQSIKERLERIENRMKSLENQSLDSIKKVKNSYESEDDFVKSDYYKTYFKNKNELELLKIALEKKRKVYEEKLETLKTNEFKVNKLKREFEQIEEQTNQNQINNQLLQEEINSYKLNFSLISEEISKLEKLIEIKKNPLTNKSKVKLFLDEVSDQNIRKALIENNHSAREIENSLMLQEDFKGLNKANDFTQLIKNEKRCNILSLFGAILNNKVLINKRNKCSRSNHTLKTSLEEMRKINSLLENLELNENYLRDSVEKIPSYREKIQTLKLTERRRERLIKNLKNKK